MFHETFVERVRLDDREAPVVELDSLRKQLGADSVSVALDRVDIDLELHRHSSLAAGIGNTVRPAEAGQARPAL